MASRSSSAHKGYYTAVGLSAGFLAFTTYVMMDDSWGWFFAAGLVGIATGIAFVFITQYYTSGSWRPVQEIANASKTGPATNIIIGTAVGFETSPIHASTRLGHALGLRSDPVGCTAGLRSGRRVAILPGRPRWQGRRRAAAR